MHCICVMNNLRHRRSREWRRYIRIIFCFSVRVCVCVLINFTSPSSRKSRSANAIFISDILMHALRAPRAAHIVNMYSRAAGIESQSTKGTQVFTQPAQGSNAPFTSAFRTGCECSHFHELTLFPPLSLSLRRRMLQRCCGEDPRRKNTVGAIKCDRRTARCRSLSASRSRRN